MDSEPLGVSCGVWYRDIGSGSFGSCRLWTTWVGLILAHAVDARLDQDLDLSLLVGLTPRQYDNIVYDV